MISLRELHEASMAIEFVPVYEMRMVTVTLNRKVMERRARLIKQRRCLGCEVEIADGEAVIRGLCSSCYQSARYYISKRRVTQEQLIQDGKMLPTGKRGRHPKSGLARELADS